MASVGDRIDAYCLKCKMLLAHVILFKVDGRVNRVQCKTCGAEHKYRPAPSADGKKTGTTPSRKTAVSKKPIAEDRTAADMALRWGEKSRNLHTDTVVRPYSIKETFQAGDVISHPTFGIGFVEKIVSNKSFYALFNDDVRLMGMNIG